MNMHRIVVGITLGLILTVATSWAGDNSQSKQRKIKGSFSGSFTPSEIDINQDHQKAGISLTTSSSNLGTATAQSLTEYLLPLPAPVTCPSNTLEFPILGGGAVSTDSKTGDQLFGQFTSGTLCLNSATGTFSFQSVETFFGGTGRYDGVTGSVQINGTGLYFVFDPVSGGGFGSQTGMFTGTITFP